MTIKRALIAGVTGAIGSALARELAARDDWQVYGLSRRASPAPIAGVEYRQLDLDDFDASRSAEPLDGRADRAPPRCSRGRPIADARRLRRWRPRTPCRSGDGHPRRAPRPGPKRRGPTGEGGPRELVGACGRADPIFEVLSGGAGHGSLSGRAAKTRNERAGPGREVVTR